jgi:glycosyltransferase involved in cell wall biosynthesis
MPALSVVMPCHNRAHDLARVLRAYDRQVGGEPFEVIAVDDASHDTTLAVITAYRPQRFTLRAERLSTRSGPAAARNRGLEVVDAPLVVFAGDDIVPESDFVAGHVAAHARAAAPEIAILGRVTWPADLPRNTLMTHIDGVGAQQFSYAYFEDGHEYDYRHFYTANVSLKTAFMQQVNARFDTDFEFAAFEDAELAFRLGQRGLRIRYDAGIAGAHYHYHTIWTFAQRQYRCGLMADVFARKHPHLAGDLRVTKTRLLLSLAAVQQLDRVWRRWRRRAAWIEDRALVLANSFEWTPHPLLDRLYLEILDYFWQRGLIDGVFRSAGVARSVGEAYAAAVLAPQLSRFLDQAMAQGLPLPWPQPRAVQRELLAARPALLRTALFGRVLPEWGRRVYNRLPRRRSIATA